jgi:hypothetical protein
MPILREGGNCQPEKSLLVQELETQVWKYMVRDKQD